MPYDDRSCNSDNYTLYVIIGRYSYHCGEYFIFSVIITRDWNTNVNSWSVFVKELENLCSEYNYILSVPFVGVLVH